MFDNPFDFLALVIAIVAFIFARKAMNQVAALRERLDLMQKLAADAGAAAVPPRLTRLQQFEQSLPPAPPGAAPQPPPIIPDVESVAPAAIPEARAQAADTAAAPPPPLPQPDLGFEETVGT